MHNINFLEPFANGGRPQLQGQMPNHIVGNHPL